MNSAQLPGGSGPAIVVGADGATGTGRRRWWPAAALLTAVAVILSMTAGPVSAARQTFDDRAHDANRGVDIRGVTIVNEDSVLVRTRFDRLQRQGSTGLTVYFDTRRRNRGPEYAAVGGLFVGTDWQALRIDGWRDRSPQLLMHCDIDLRVRYGRGGTATYELARGCLRRPDEIRVSARSGGPGPDDWAPRHRTFYRAVDHR
jgi:hypothetical protein